jgi:argininosuccinate lyase
VKKGATFREAHGAVGSLVRQAEEAGIEMTELPADAFGKAHALFGSDARDALGAEASLAARNIAGGTGPDAVKAQIAQAHAALAGAAL